MRGFFIASSFSLLFLVSMPEPASATLISYPTVEVRRIPFAHFMKRLMANRFGLTPAELARAVARAHMLAYMDRSEVLGVAGPRNSIAVSPYYWRCTSGDGEGVLRWTGYPDAIMPNWPLQGYCGLLPDALRTDSLAPWIYRWYGTPPPPDRHLAQALVAYRTAIALAPEDRDLQIAYAIALRYASEDAKRRDVLLRNVVWALSVTRMPPLNFESDRAERLFDPGVDRDQFERVGLILSEFKSVALAEDQPLLNQLQDRVAALRRLPRLGPLQY